MKMRSFYIQPIFSRAPLIDPPPPPNWSHTPLVRHECGIPTLTTCVIYVICTRISQTIIFKGVHVLMVTISKVISIAPEYARKPQIVTVAQISTLIILLAPSKHLI